MGNREDLLDGAIRCLREKGWARTTVRDIAAAAGVSHAAIGYHYGSREALLVAAVIGAMDEWGGEIAKALASDPETGPAARFEAQWTAMIRSFAGHRPMWLASIDALVQSEHAPQLREQLAAGQDEGRRGVTAGLLGVGEDALSDDDVRTLGSVQMALIPGVMMQCLLDPEHAPTGADVVAGLRTMARLIESPGDEITFLHDARPGSHDTGRMTTTTTATGVPSVWPCVPYRDEPAALRFLTEAFGFTERSVYRDGDRLVHVELTWPGPQGSVAGGVMFGSIDEADPDRAPYGRTSVHVVTDDPDGLHDRAVAAGAVVVRPLEDTDYGSRQFVVRDPEGNIWSFGTWYET